MPKTKKEVSSSDSDSGPEDKNPAPEKKQKVSKSSGAKSGGGLEKNDAGEYVFELSKMRQVSVKDFKGRVYVNIREYYQHESGEMRPGKKGIALSVEQWNKFKEHFDDIDKAVKELS